MFSATTRFVLFQELPKRCDGLLTGTTPAALGEALTHSQVGVVEGAVQAMRCRSEGDSFEGERR